MFEKLGVAVVGLGMVAQTHLRALCDLKSELNIEGFVSRNKVVAEQYAAEATRQCQRRAVSYADLDDLCCHRAVDFAIVLTPPNARLEFIEALAKAGKHILLEKPIARTTAEAKQIVEICAQHNITLGIVFQHRMRGASIELKRLIETGRFGKLCIAEVNVPWWRDQSYYDEPGRGTYHRDGGGVLISQAIHSLDLLMSMTGRISEVQAMATTTAFHKMESEDYVNAGLRFQNGAVGSLIASTASYPGDAESISLHFEKAAAHLQSGVLTVKWRDGHMESFGATAATGAGADPMAFTHDWHRDIIADFAASIRENREPEVSGREALDAHCLIDGLTSSSKQRRAIEVNYQEITIHG